MNPDTIILITEGAAAAGLLAGVIRLQKKKSALRARRNAESDQRRVRELDQLLHNPAKGRADGGTTGILRPYEEKYASEGSSVHPAPGAAQMELIVRTPSSERRYLVQLQDPILIGKDSPSNLRVESQQVADCAVRIRADRGVILAQNVSLDHSVLIERSGSRRKVTDQPVRLKNRDRLLLGDVTVDLMM